MRWSRQISPPAIAWLFLNGWVEMPDGRDDDYKRANEIRERLRAKALQEIFDATGWTGIEELIRRAGAPGLVGWQIAHAYFPEADVVAWSLKRFADCRQSISRPCSERSGPCAATRSPHSTTHAGLRQARLSDNRGICQHRALQSRDVEYSRPAAGRCAGDLIGKGCSPEY